MRASLCLYGLSDQSIHIPRYVNKTSEQGNTDIVINGLQNQQVFITGLYNLGAILDHSYLFSAKVIVT
jgi:hypothetical protein